MKKLLKSVAILTIFAMMLTGMSMMAFAAEGDEDETEDVVATDATVDADDEDEDAPADVTAAPETTDAPVTTSNPETGVGSTTVAVAGLALVSLATAVATSRKR